MSVQLEPSEVLSFKRPLTRMSKEVLVVRNPTDLDIAFKIKTTAPKLYCVRPNAGVVAAGKSQEVQVMLQPFKEEPPLEQKCKDKFLVQTISLVDDIKQVESTELWPYVESKAKGLIQQIKLRCEYVTEEMEKKVVDAIPVQASKFEVVAPSTESDLPPPMEPISRPVEQMTEAQFPADEMAKMRLELDAYRNELESLRARGPGVAVDSITVKSNSISWPLAVVIALLSFLVSFVILKKVA